MSLETLSITRKPVTYYAVLKLQWYQNWWMEKKKTKCWVGLDLSMWNSLDGCGLLLVDLMWVTCCPALTPVYTSSEKRSDI